MSIGNCRCPKCLEFNSDADTAYAWLSINPDHLVPDIEVYIRAICTPSSQMSLDGELWCDTSQDGANDTNIKAQVYNLDDYRK